MPKLIVYRGHTPEVSVPAHRLTATAGVPVEVPDHVAADLTAGGTSTVWLEVDAKPSAATTTTTGKGA